MPRSGEKVTLEGREGSRNTKAPSSCVRWWWVAVAGAVLVLGNGEGRGEGRGQWQLYINTTLGLFNDTYIRAARCVVNCSLSYDTDPFSSLIEPRDSSLTFVRRLVPPPNATSSTTTMSTLQSTSDTTSSTTTMSTLQSTSGSMNGAFSNMEEEISCTKNSGLVLKAVSSTVKTKSGINSNLQTICNDEGWTTVDNTTLSAFIDSVFDPEWQTRGGVWLGLQLDGDRVLFASDICNTMPMNQVEKIFKNKEVSINFNLGDGDNCFIRASSMKVLVMSCRIMMESPAACL